MKRPLEVAQVEAARARGWKSLGDRKRAEAALDRAMVALTHAEDDCAPSERGLLERLHVELDAADDHGCGASTSRGVDD